MTNKLLSFYKLIKIVKKIYGCAVYAFPISVNQTNIWNKKTQALLTNCVSDAVIFCGYAMSKLVRSITWQE